MCLRRWVHSQIVGTTSQMMRKVSPAWKFWLLVCALAFAFNLRAAIVPPVPTREFVSSSHLSPQVATSLIFFAVEDDCVGFASRLGGLHKIQNGWVTYRSVVGKDFGGFSMMINNGKMLMSVLPLGIRSQEFILGLIGRGIFEINFALDNLRVYHACEAGGIANHNLANANPSGLTPTQFEVFAREVLRQPVVVNRISTEPQHAHKRVFVQTRQKVSSLFLGIITIIRPLLAGMVIVCGLYLLNLLRFSFRSSAQSRAPGKELLLILILFSHTGSVTAAIATFTWEGSVEFGERTWVAVPLQVASPGEWEFNQIQSISVSLTITGGRNSGIAVRLQAPTGQYIYLINRPGVGYGRLPNDSGFVVMITDSATYDIHLYHQYSYSTDQYGRVLGSWQPDGRDVDPATGKGDAYKSATRTALNDIFRGVTAVGTWYLYIGDWHPGGGSPRLERWVMEIEPIPEPTTTTIFLVGALFTCVLIRLKTTKRP